MRNTLTRLIAATLAVAFTLGALGCYGEEAPAEPATESSDSSSTATED